MRKPLSRTQGFTLLELLVVVALMAIVATVALVANDGVQDEAAMDATKYEMAELRKAMLQFRRDVGHFPTSLHLLTKCLDSDDPDCDQNVDPQKTWNPDTRRGWHGPYLNNVGEEFAFKDAWYDPDKPTLAHSYLLKNPGLDSSEHSLWCKADGTDCQVTKDATHYVPNNGARIVSTGPNGTDEDDNKDDVCERRVDSDDIVVCLLR